jgi:prepilin-type N-terminal cleavage/methylation domain-containing protein
MKKGYTLVELLITMAILVALAVVILPNFLGLRANGGQLIAVTEQLVSLLRNTQAQSMNQTSEAAWGIHFVNATNTRPYYVIFQGNSFASGTIQQAKYLIPGGIAYTTSTLAVGASTDVIFAPLSGAASATTIGFYLTASSSISSTVSIGSSGQIIESLPQ